MKKFIILILILSISFLNSTIAQDWSVEPFAKNLRGRAKQLVKRVNTSAYKKNIFFKLLAISKDGNSIAFKKQYRSKLLHVINGSGKLKSYKVGKTTSVQLISNSGQILINNHKRQCKLITPIKKITLQCGYLSGGYLLADDKLIISQNSIISRTPYTTQLDVYNIIDNSKLELKTSLEIADLLETFIITRTASPIYNETEFFFQVYSTWYTDMPFLSTYKYSYESGLSKVDELSFKGNSTEIDPSDDYPSIIGLLNDNNLILKKLNDLSYKVFNVKTSELSDELPIISTEDEIAHYNTFIYSSLNIEEVLANGEPTLMTPIRDCKVNNNSLFTIGNFNGASNSLVAAESSRIKRVGNYRLVKLTFDMNKEFTDCETN